MDLIKIAVVGLGLIGGSFCKAIAAKTEHYCMGLDTDSVTINAALKDGAIQKEITAKNLSEADLTIVCLHPEKAISFLLENQKNFRKNSIVIDVCGVKQTVMDKVTLPLHKNGVTFIGAHPMAGREVSGYASAKETLFHNASFIMVKPDYPCDKPFETVKALAKSLGFTKIVSATAEEHDRIIAYTSQLAHVVSSAYVKSPTLQKRRGFSAGSFLDMTRVAQLDETMWTALFFMNKEPLLFEIEHIISELNAYKQALLTDDKKLMEQLLKQGRILKQENLQ